MLLFVYTTTLKRFVIFTWRYFKLSRNTTALSQSNCRNFSCSSIILFTSYWLQDNKHSNFLNIISLFWVLLQIRKLTCLSSNYQLRELYLQDNLMVELNGCLKHLTCLQVLLLNGNQLLKLTDVIHELRAMQCLKKLSRCNVICFCAANKYWLSMILYFFFFFFGGGGHLVQFFWFLIKWFYQYTH